MEAKERAHSVDDWLNLPEPSFPSLKSDKEDGLVYTVLKVGFLAAPEADCRKKGLKAQPRERGQAGFSWAVELAEGSPFTVHGHFIPIGG